MFIDPTFLVRSWRRMHGTALSTRPCSCNEGCWQGTARVWIWVVSEGVVYWLWYCSKSLFPSTYFSTPKMSACPIWQNVPDDYHSEEHDLLNCQWMIVRISTARHAPSAAWSGYLQGLGRQARAMLWLRILCVHIWTCHLQTTCLASLSLSFLICNWG